MEFLIGIGLIWLVRTILGNRTPKTQPQPKPTVDPALEAERLAKLKHDDDHFKEVFGQWIGNLSEVITEGGDGFPREPPNVFSPSTRLQSIRARPGSRQWETHPRKKPCGCSSIS